MTTTRLGRSPIRVNDELAPERTLGDRFLILLSLILMGYAIDGRGFAYLGVPPLFVGEITLLVGIVAFLNCRAWIDVLSDRYFWPLLALCAWGAVRTVPYLSVDGIDAVRDAVVWGYSVFGLTIAALVMERPARLGEFVGRYRIFIPWFLCCIPFVFIAYHGMGDNRPEWPWAEVPIIQVKEGDVLVHLGGVMAFCVCGLAGEISYKWIVLLVFEAAVMGVIDRAGMLSFIVIFFLCFAFKPMQSAIGRAAGALLLAIVILWATNINIPIAGGKGRDVSFEQVLTNVNSMLFDTGNDGLDSTKEWRIDWWKTIEAYTLHGKYFWTGKGFGINLADDDGFQVMADHSLRNPHDVHMTFLARAGVPGLALWLLTQACWGVVMVLSFFSARREKFRQWEGLFFFLTCYWLALLINGSFDVFIEGPMGGIWFWSIFGTGIASVWVYRNRPEVFAPLDDQPLDESDIAL